MRAGFKIIMVSIDKLRVGKHGELIFNAEVRPFGLNSAHVIVPKEWRKKHVEIRVIE